MSQPHNDALVLTLVISNYKTHHSLINNKSLVDIFYLLTFDQMGIRQDKLKSVQSPLVDFTGDRLLPLRTISLLVTTEMDNKKITKVIDLLVVDGQIPIKTTYAITVGIND